MFTISNLKSLGAAATLALAFGASSVSAATVTAFAGVSPDALDLNVLDENGGVTGDFLFAPINTTTGSGSGNCGGTCLQFNPNQTTTMTTNPAGGTFNLTSLSFILDGQNAELGVFNLSFGAPGTVIISVAVADTIDGTTIAHNNWYDLNFEGAADGVTSILFDNLGQGNLRIGNIVASVETTETIAPIPLPAAGWLLVTALGGLGAAGLRRRRKDA